jgi:hypothetical protein
MLFVMEPKEPPLPVPGSRSSLFEPQTRSDFAIDTILFLQPMVIEFSRFGFRHLVEIILLSTAKTLKPAINHNGFASNACGVHRRPWKRPLPSRIYSRVRGFFFETINRRWKASIGETLTDDIDRLDPLSRIQTL